MPGTVARRTNESEGSVDCERGGRSHPRGRRSRARRRGQDGRRHGRLRRHQRVQGSGRMLGCGPQLRRKERLQGPGLGRDVQGRVREEGRQGRRAGEEVGSERGRAPGPPLSSAIVDAFPYLGHGIGLRTRHFPRVLDGTARPDWFEAISENFMIRGGRPLHVLERARAAAPVVLHGVSLSLGSSDPLNDRYLTALGELAARVEPAWISDHLCWGGHGGHYAHDLLPLPYTEEALALVVGRIATVQDRLGRRILVENVSSYLTFTHSTMAEWEFLAAVAEGADCGILLDVNNVYGSAVNHGFSAEAYLDGLPRDRIGQIHLAGHSDRGTHLLDTHDAAVVPAVWDLFRGAVARFGRISTLVEWDDHIPELEEVLAEADRARAAEA